MQLFDTMAMTAKKAKSQTAVLRSSIFKIFYVAQTVYAAEVLDFKRTMQGSFFVQFVQSMQFIRFFQNCTCLISVSNSHRCHDAFTPKLAGFTTKNVLVKLDPEI